MHFKRELQVLFIMTVLLVSSCFSFFISPVQAQGQTTLYFVNSSPSFVDDSFGGLFGNPELSHDKPTTTNTTFWPPRLLAREGKLLPEVGSEEWLLWVEMWVFYQFADQLLGFEEFEEGEEDIISSFFDMYNPFRVSQDFVYRGNNTVTIDDDISFTLYMKSQSRLLQKDQVKVGLSKASLFSSIELCNATADIPLTLLPNRIKPMTVTVSPSNATIELDDDDVLTVFVEIIPSSYLLGRMLNRLSERGFEERIINTMDSFATFLSNRNNEEISNIGDTILDFINLSESFSEEGVNLSLVDVAELTDGLRCSQFVFGSSQYSSHVQLPLEIKPEFSENKVTYYLHENNEMDQQQPSSEEAQQQALGSDPISWIGAAPPRNKILEEATLSVFLDYRNILNIRKLFLTADLYQGETQIASTTIKLDRSTLSSLLSGELLPVNIEFQDLNEYELTYSSNIRVDLYLGNTSTLGLRKCAVVYDSTEAPSKLELLYEETTNIGFTKTSIPSDQEIIPGGSVHYLINVTSKYQDEITVDTSIETKSGKWDIHVVPESFSIAADTTTTVHTYINSSTPEKTAYGNDIEVTIEVAGNTGIARDTLLAEVSTDAKTYDIILEEAPEDTVFIPRDESRIINITFVNNNTGAIDDADNYDIEVFSESEWDISYPSVISGVLIGTQKTISIEVTIPDGTNITEDVLEIIITSQSNSNSELTVFVPVEVGSSVFDMIAQLFSGFADSLGLTDIFGDDAMFILIIIMILIIFIILSAIALILTSKYTELSCEEPIKEIAGDEYAEFIIQIHNPTSKKRQYLLKVHTTEDTTWDLVINEAQLTVDGKQSQTTTISLVPPDDVSSGDWVEAQVTVQPQGKTKTQSLSILAMIEGGAPDITVGNVTHAPTQFSAGDRIVTRFSIHNQGPVAAQDIAVFLFINGKQKNKVQGITIPGRGYADLELPWIAEEGENKVHITVIKKQ